MLTMTMISCYSEVWTSFAGRVSFLQLKNPTGAMLIVQPGDCLSRGADVALVSRELQILEIVVLAEGSHAEIDAVVNSLPVGMPVRLMHPRTGRELQRHGIASTPAVIAWDKIGDTTMYLSLRSSRQELYRQLRALGPFSRTQSHRPKP